MKQQGFTFNPVEHLLTNDGKFRVLYSDSPYGILFFDTNGNVKDCNKRLADIIGSDWDEMHGVSLLQLPGKEIADTCMKVVDGSPASYSGDYTSVISGRHTHVHVFAWPVYSDHCRIIGGMGIVDDMTEVKRTALAAQESNKHMNAIIQVVPDIIFVMSAEGMFLEVHGSAPESLLAPSEKIVGSYLEDFFPPEEARQQLSIYRKCLEEQRLITYAYSLPLPGDERFFEARISPVDDQKVLALIRDVTESVKAASELRTKTETLDVFFEISSDMLCITDTKGRLLKVNKAWQDVLGYHADELEQVSCIDFVHPDDHQITHEAMASLNHGDQVLDFINRYRCKDGTYRRFSWRSKLSGHLILGVARECAGCA